MNASMIKSLKIKQLKEFKRIQDTPLNQDCFDEIQCFPECGGIDIFIGTVRNHHEGKAVQALTYTAYAPVAEKMIRQIEQEVQQKHAVSYVRVIHRVGALEIGEKAIIAIAYAPHRREAFEACEELIERVKHEVPVWKEEFYTDGSSQFVEGCCIRKDYTAQPTSIFQSQVLVDSTSLNQHLPEDQQSMESSDSCCAGHTHSQHQLHHQIHNRVLTQVSTLKEIEEQE